MECCIQWLGFSIVVPINSRSFYVFLPWLRLISSAFLLEIKKKKKHARCISVTNHKCRMGISSIFDTVFRYLPIFLTVLRYWVPPNVPLYLQHFMSIEQKSVSSFPGTGRSTNSIAWKRWLLWKKWLLQWSKKRIILMSKTSRFTGKSGSVMENRGSRIG